MFMVPILARVELSPTILKEDGRDKGKIATFYFVRESQREQSITLVQRLIEHIDPSTPRPEGQEGEQKCVSLVSNFSERTVSVYHCSWRDDQIRTFMTVVKTVAGLYGIPCP